MGRELLQPPLRRDPRSLAFADALERLGQIPLSPVLVYHLDTVGADVLPFLAEQFSVTGLEGWHWLETDEERRHLVRNAISLHQLKGTLEGYRTILRMARASVRTYIAPPDMPHLGDALTAEWAAYLAQMPQLRLYRYDNRGLQQGAILRDHRLFLVEGTATAKRHKLYPALSDAIRRIRERAFEWRPDGSTEELIVYDRERIAEDRFATTAETIIRPGQPIGVFLLDHRDYPDPPPAARFVGLRSRKGHGFLVDHDPLSRMYRLDFTEPYLSETDGFKRRLIAPGYEQLRVQYELIAERGTARGLFTDGRCYPTDSRPTPVITLPELVSPNPAWKLAWNVGGSTLEVVPYYGHPVLNQDNAIAQSMLWLAMPHYFTKDSAQVEGSLFGGATFEATGLAIPDDVSGAWWPAPDLEGVDTADAFSLIWKGAPLSPGSNAGTMLEVVTDAGIYSTWFKLARHTTEPYLHAIWRNNIGDEVHDWGYGWNSQTQFTTSTTPLTWVVTFSGSSFDVYLDGAHVFHRDYVDMPGVSFSGPARIVVGNRHNTDTLDGLHADQVQMVAICNRALTQAEALSLSENPNQVITNVPS